MNAIEQLRDVIAEDGRLTEVGCNVLRAPATATNAAQEQTNQAFTRKWNLIAGYSKETQRLSAFERDRYLKLYGFSSENDLATHLRECRFVIDCGCGLGAKTAWLGEICPDSVVVGVDLSEAVYKAAELYQEDYDNVLFLHADIGSMPFFKKAAFDYVNCDQAIHHTSNPRAAFSELKRITAPEGELTCYVYRKKAVPRELLDEYFREQCVHLTHSEMVAFAEQMTELGRILSCSTEEQPFPNIPVLGIEGGKMSVQRFFYWNFAKCFWNEELGREASMIVNYDWYAPSQAARFSEAEFRQWVEEEGLRTIHFNLERACFSGRFARTD